MHGERGGKRERRKEEESAERAFSMRALRACELQIIIIKISLPLGALFARPSVIRFVRFD